ncbi:MAG: RbsD/FucU domain-containing protein [Aurantimicrobium sp.]|uniref:RbsD/FucU family protein n=1 Tax=Aurantimicrobium sp. TaxID=1930784 RepID=UPI002FC82731
MLHGISPLLEGEILSRLYKMGHGDYVLIADANYPADAHARHIITLPGTTSPEVLEAIRSVIPADAYDGPSVSLMKSEQASLLDVQKELVEVAAVDQEQFELVERFAFYEKANGAYLTIRTGETRTYANALLRKGVVMPFRGYPRPAQGIGPSK